MPEDFYRNSARNQLDPSLLEELGYTKLWSRLSGAENVSPEAERAIEHRLNRAIPPEMTDLAEIREWLTSQEVYVKRIVIEEHRLHVAREGLDVTREMRDEQMALGGTAAVGALGIREALDQDEQQVSEIESRIAGMEENLMDQWYRSPEGLRAAILSGKFANEFEDAAGQISGDSADRDNYTLQIEIAEAMLASVPENINNQAEIQIWYAANGKRATELAKEAVELSILNDQGAISPDEFDARFNAIATKQADLYNNSYAFGQTRDNALESAQRDLKTFFMNHEKRMTQSGLQSPQISK